MPPPPSQQGKFKPKKPKPKKKIKAGAATAAAAAAAAEPKTTVSFAPSAYSGRGRGEGRGGGRGRGGRGRGRMPMPTGKVYFTGGDKKKSAASSSSRSGSTRSSSGSRSVGRGGGGGGSRTNRETATTEEVVGQLDVAIGSSKEGSGRAGAAKDSILDSMDFEDQEGQLFRPAAAAQGNLSLEGFMYDTDSSEEEEARRRKKKTESIISPLELPLKDPNAQSSQIEEPRTRQAGDFPEPVASATTTSAGTGTESHTQQSPFSNLKEGESSSKDDWFLVQLPTRLPPLRQKVDENAAAMKVDDEQEREQVATTEEPVTAYSEVVTHPVVSGGFDNALLSAAPGRIGKMVVYKSGRTVLVMEGTDGSTLQLNVAEGLSCSFLQQAVAIDPQKNSYTELGEVGKSLVVSPILDPAQH